MRSSARVIVTTSLTLVIVTVSVATWVPAVALSSNVNGVVVSGITNDAIDVAAPLRTCVGPPVWTHW